MAKVRSKSARQNFRTPLYIFGEISKRFGPFDVDLAAEDSNTLCEKWFTEEDSAFDHAWNGYGYCNPPYNNILPWVSKAIRDVFFEQTAERIVMLLPVRSGTTWMDWVELYGRVHRIKKRIHFELDGKAMSNPNEDSCIVVFERNIDATALRKSASKSGSDKAHSKPRKHSTEASTEHQPQL